MQQLLAYIVPQGRAYASEIAGLASICGTRAGPAQDFATIAGHCAAGTAGRYLHWEGIMHLGE